MLRVALNTIKQTNIYGKGLYIWVRVMVFNATINTISFLSWRSVLLVEETGVPRENQRPVANHWLTLSHNVCIEYTSQWSGCELTTLVVTYTDCTGSCKSNNHTFMTTTTLSTYVSIMVMRIKNIYKIIFQAQHKSRYIELPDFLIYSNKTPNNLIFTSIILICYLSTLIVNKKWSRLFHFACNTSVYLSTYRLSWFL